MITRQVKGSKVFSTTFWANQILAKHEYVDGFVFHPLGNYAPRRPWSALILTNLPPPPSIL